MKSKTNQVLLAFAVLLVLTVGCGNSGKLAGRIGVLETQLAVQAEAPDSVVTGWDIEPSSFTTTMIRLRYTINGVNDSILTSADSACMVAKEIGEPLPNECR